MKLHLLLFLLACFNNVAKAQLEEDLLPFPLGPLGGKAFQQKGTSLLKVTELTPDGLASMAGLRVNDFIYAVNDERLPLVGPVHVDGWRGAVSELGYAIERAENSGAALSLQVLRAGTGSVSVSMNLPSRPAWKPSYPAGDARMREHFDKVCADLHSLTEASADGNFAYKTGFFGLILLAHPDWNRTSGARPYRRSLDKLMERCAAHLGRRIPAPQETSADCGSDPGLENWDICSSAMFLGEYRRKTGAANLNSVVQLATEMIANRIQNYPQLDNAGAMHQKLGRMGHCGVVGDYPHAALSGLNIMNAHAMIAMGILKGAGADFSAASGNSGMTIDQKYLLNWTWLKSCTSTAGGNVDGNVGYGGIQTDSYDSAARTAGSAAGYEIYRSAGGTAATADDLDKLNRMKAYTPRNWQRQQHAHAYTLGGVAFSHMLLPFVSVREQRYFLDNERFFFTLGRDAAGEMLYFPGRALSSGDNQDRTRLISPGLTWAVLSGNLPSFPAPANAASRVFVRMNAPRHDWPQLDARRVRAAGLTQNLDLDVTDYQGNVLTSGYSATWSRVSGATVSFSSPNSLDTAVTFSAAGNYRLQLSVTAGSFSVTEPYDFAVVTSVNPPDTSAVITQQPVSRYFIPGENARLTVAVSGGGPFGYQWKLDGEDYGEPLASPELSIPNLSTGNAGVYQCFIFHPGGLVVSNPCHLCLAGTTTLAAGGLKREVWNNTSGVTVASLTASGRYPRCPDVTGAVTEAEATRDYGNNYGQRLSGWVIPPVTGNYTFYFATDDAGELWLSTDEFPSGKQKITAVTQYAGYREYSKYQAATISLTAGKRYYIEALQVDGGGDFDHLSIAWRKPGDPVPANGSAPIPGTYLQRETFTPEPGFEDMVSWWPMDEGAGAVGYDTMSTGNDGALTGPAWTAGKKGSALLFDGTGKVQCSNNGALGGLSEFTVAAWVKVNAGNNQEGVIVQQRMTGETIGNGQYQLLVNAEGNIRFFCYGDDVDQFNFAGTAVINDGQWHHVAGLRDAVGGGRIYVDGLLNGSVTGTTRRNLKTETTIAIGADTRDGGTFFRGAIDDVRIYGCALSAGQIASLTGSPGRWSTDAWTGDTSTGILSGSAWAYHFGSTTAATVAGETVTGLAGASPSVAGRFAITGPTDIYSNDANNLTGTGSAVLAKDFLYGGNPTTITLQGLTSGRSYVATILSAGWEAPGLRQATFASGGDTILLDQNQYGNNNGIRVDYAFTAQSASKVITITPATANTFHLYALALRQGYIVTNECDFGSGSLRQALADAAVAPTTDTITFAPALDGAQIDCLTPLAINDSTGATVDATSLTSGLTLSGRGQNRLFHVAAGSSLSCRRLRLVSGRAAGVFPNSYGGAILAQGALDLTDCSISGCSASIAGGAIAVIGPVEVSLERCALVNNSAGYGGAVQNEGTFIAQTSTFAGNTATQAGGAISAPFNHSTLLRHCTLSANAAGVSGGAHDGTGLLIENSIAAGNTAPTGANLNGTPSAATGANLLSGSPMLSPPGDFGGFTATMLPLPGSPAINAATSTLTTAPVDQRGYARDATPDTGAAEYRGRSDLALYWTDDWDGDDVPNGAELALGMNPLIEDRNSPKNLTAGRDNDGRVFSTFAHNPSLNGKVIWVLSTSTDLASWTPAFTFAGLLQLEFLNGRTGSISEGRFTIIEPPGTEPHRYFRFAAELLP